MMKKLLPLLVLLGGLVQAAPVRDKHVTAELLSEMSTIAPGQPFWVGLRLVHDEHWHTYWINDGDSGLPTEIAWDLPDGFTADPIQWPYPQRIPMEPLVSYGYEGETMLLVQITPPAQIDADAVTLSARVRWLMCKEVCIPGRAEFSLTLPVAATSAPDPAAAGVFTDARRKLPSIGTDWDFMLEPRGDRLVLTATPPEGAPALEQWEVFAVEKGIVAAAVTSMWSRTEAGYTTEFTREYPDDPAPAELRLVMASRPSMAAESYRQAIDVTIPVGGGASQGAIATATPPPGSLLSISIFAFLGGLILNLMPCVFPVISLKILGFVNQAQDHPRKVWHHGLVFASGVVVSFWILAGILMALRAGGESIGWGFQLQSPPVLIVLSVVFLGLALNLFGVFEMGLSLTAAGGNLAGKQGWAGSFFSGFLATVIATPCTAPFMGVALGYALTQPPYVGMVVFTALALGMAFPYLLLSRYPALLKRLPRPGPWMETMKQVMGFLLLATVVWLFWVLAALVSTDSLTRVVAAFFLTGLSAWILGKWTGFERARGVRIAARLSALVVIAAGLSTALRGIETSGDRAAADNGWLDFTPELLSELRAEGKPVFIDFTAKWCLTCQVNKLTVLRKDDIMAAFRENGVTLLYADWTDENEVIAAELARHGRQSVPLYLLYPAGTDAPPAVLPEILTRKIVLDALQNIN